jgi:UDP-N-acetylmuramate--alanine ligase
LPRRCRRPTRLLVTEVYAAGEAPIANADGRAICRAVRRPRQVEPVFVPHIDELNELLTGVLESGDVLLTLGAGNIGAMALQLRELHGESATSRSGGAT